MEDLNISFDVYGGRTASDSSIFMLATKDKLLGRQGDDGIRRANPNLEHHYHFLTSGNDVKTILEMTATRGRQLREGCQLRISSP